MNGSCPMAIALDDVCVFSLWVLEADDCEYVKNTTDPFFAVIISNIISVYLYYF